MDTPNLTDAGSHEAAMPNPTVLFPTAGTTDQDPPVTPTGAEPLPDYNTPEFRARLIEHFTRARNAAIADHVAAGRL